MSLRFTGHETFVVRTFWPKKGYDFIRNNGNFSSENAVVDLGVGKNMVASINFWMKALGLYDEKNKVPTEIADYIFSGNGFDPFLEDIGTIWLLHYYLIKTNYASIYSLIFNELRRERAVFNKSQLKAFIKRKYQELDDNTFNLNTVEKDISVFTRLYGKIDYLNSQRDFEEEVNSLMAELELISVSVEDEIKEGTNKREKVEWYHLHGESRNTLPVAVLLFAILDRFENDKTIAGKRIENDTNSPGLIFLLTKDDLYKKLKQIENSYSGVVLSETAGNLQLVIPEGMDKWDILRNYYAR